MKDFISPFKEFVYDFAILVNIYKFPLIENLFRSVMKKQGVHSNAVLLTEVTSPEICRLSIETILKPEQKKIILDLNNRILFHKCKASLPEYYDFSIISYIQYFSLITLHYSVNFIGKIDPDGAHETCKLFLKVLANNSSTRMFD